MNRPIADIAFLDLTKDDLKALRESFGYRTTLVVNEGASARTVALAADRDHKDLVVVVNNSNDITGMVVPQWIRKQMRNIVSVEGATFHGVLGKFAAESNQRGDMDWHHEWLNCARPVTYECQAGPHVIAGPKCRQHPNARTVRRP